MQMTRYITTTAVIMAMSAGIAFGFGDFLKGVTGGGNNSIKGSYDKNKQVLSGATEMVGAATSTQSEVEEIATGKQLAGNLLGAAPLVKNPVLQEYVNKVGLWVAMQSERPDLPWRFGVIDTESINAFATPGGYVFITKGLYHLLSSEEDLAGVLGHEIAHIVKQHHWDVIKKQKLLAGATKMASSQTPDNAAIQKLLGSGAEMCARGLDKGAEYEADRMGVVLARRAGYDAGGLYNVLDRIAAKPSKEASLLYSTHPAPVDRENGLSDAFAASPDILDGGKKVNRLVKIN